MATSMTGTARAVEPWTSISRPSVVGNRRLATGPHRVGVIRMIDLPCRAIAARYSSQSGCSPEMQRKYSTSGSRAAGMSSTSASPSTCTQGPLKSSDSTTTDARAERRALVVLARCG